MTKDELEKIITWRRAGVLPDGRKATVERIGEVLGYSKQYISLICKEYEAVPPTHLNHRRVFKELGQMARWVDQHSKPTDPNFPHGTYRGFYRECRCEACREANRLRTIAQPTYRPKNHPSAYVCGICGQSAWKTPVKSGKFFWRHSRVTDHAVVPAPRDMKEWDKFIRKIRKEKPWNTPGEVQKLLGVQEPLPKYAEDGSINWLKR